MKKLFLLVVLAMAGCQTENLNIQGPYRIKFLAAPVSSVLRVGEQTRVYMNLQTDSHYSQTGYRLTFYQETGLGRLEKDSMFVPQNVAIPLALGRSSCYFTPAGAGNSQIILVARQERGYMPPDTVRINFQVNP